MDMLKKFFPFSFKEKKDIAALVINVVIYLVVGLIAGFAIGLLANLIVGLLGGLIDLYVFVGIVLSILDYLKVLK